MLPNMAAKNEIQQDAKMVLLNNKIDKLSKIVDTQYSIIKELRRDIK